MCTHKMLYQLVNCIFSKSFTYRRLCYLESRFNLHEMLNEHKELKAQKMVPHRDFYNVRKVSFALCPVTTSHFHLSQLISVTHIHHFLYPSPCVPPSLLLMWTHTYMPRPA